MSFPGGSGGKEYACSVWKTWVGKIPWSRAWQPTPVSCLENPHGQRSLASLVLWLWRMPLYVEMFAKTYRNEILCLLQVIFKNQEKYEHRKIFNYRIQFKNIFTICSTFLYGCMKPSMKNSFPREEPLKVCVTHLELSKSVWPSPQLTDSQQQLAL